MLILSRKVGETLVLDGGIEITVAEVSGDKVKLGITAPPQVKVYRKELYETIRENRAAAQQLAPGSLEGLLGRIK